MAKWLKDYLSFGSRRVPPQPPKPDYTESEILKAYRLQKNLDFEDPYEHAENRTRSCSEMSHAPFGSPVKSGTLDTKSPKHRLIKVESQDMGRGKILLSCVSLEEPDPVVPSAPDAGDLDYSDPFDARPDPWPEPEPAALESSSYMEPYQAQRLLEQLQLGQTGGGSRGDVQLYDTPYEERERGRGQGAVADEERERGRGRGAVPDEERERGRGRGVVPDEERERGRGRGMVPDEERERGRGWGAVPDEERERGRGRGTVPDEERERGRGWAAVPDEERERGRGRGVVPDEERERGRGRGAVPDEERERGRGWGVVPDEERESRLPQDDERPADEYDQPWEWKKDNISKALAVQFDGADWERSGVQSERGRPPRSSPQTGGAGVRFRKAPECHGMLGERVDPAQPLDKQVWYHGALTRSEAESLLTLCKECSYLVRHSQTCRTDLSLSLRSCQGFMHMKFSKSRDGKYILGQNSPPFDSIPQVIHYYTTHKLPIRGAEHLSLLFPVVVQTL